MNLYFACAPGKAHLNILKGEKVENILISYHFIKNARKLATLLNDTKPKRVLIDSGAFSVWSNDGVVSLENYTNFCIALKELLSPSIELNVINLDVLPGKKGFVPNKEAIHKSTKEGWKNMLYMESKGLKVMHTFHQYEDISVLDKLLKHSNYIGISSNKDATMNSQLAWFRKIFLKTKGNVKTHAFAATSERQLFQFPFYSCDSSSWVTPSRYGKIPLMLDNYRIKSIAYKDVNDIEKYWKYLSFIGMDAIGSKVDWATRITIAIRTYKKLEEVATKLWTQRGVTWK